MNEDWVDVLTASIADIIMRVRSVTGPVISIPVPLPSTQVLTLGRTVDGRVGAAIGGAGVWKGRAWVADVRKTQNGMNAVRTSPAVLVSVTARMPYMYYIVVVLPLLASVGGDQKNVGPTGNRRAIGVAHKGGRVGVQPKALTTLQSVSDTPAPVDD